MSLHLDKYRRDARNSMVKESVKGYLGEKKFLYILELLRYCVDSDREMLVKELLEKLEKQYKTKVLKLP